MSRKARAMWVKPPLNLEISEILSVGDKDVWVVEKKTGKSRCLPVDHVDFLPGCVRVPAWLAEKMGMQEG